MLSIAPLVELILKHKNSFDTYLQKLVLKMSSKYSLTKATTIRSAPVISGGHQGVGSTLQVEKHLHHPDSAAGAQTAHDNKREQQVVTAS